MNSAELALYLEAGFIDYDVKTDERFLPKILTNNQEQKVKVLENLLYELENCDEFFFSVAFVTNSGIACLIDTLKELENKHIKGKILASQYQNFTEPRALRRLLQFPNLELKIITSDYNFHAKGYLFHKQAKENQEDNYTMIIGSSNLTQSALTVNREWNVQLSSMKNGALIKQMQEELNHAWDDATPVTEDWISVYEKVYKEARGQRLKGYARVRKLYKVSPNKMQTAALNNIARLRAEGKDKALLISATGTGKTYLSAFDVRIARPKRFLFIVHRGLIARKSKESFEQIIDEHITTGLFTNSRKDIHADYIFATVQTLNKDENLKMFSPDTFDYIVVDEVHHAGAKTYQKVLNYFKSKFLLGMTATPERTDGYDIFKDFNYNIAYEIRLHQALAENMLVPFHYHGVSEIMVDGKLLDDDSAFNLLTSEERVKNILYYADFYGCDQGRIKGLVFCRNRDEAKKLAEAFNLHGKRAAYIGGDTSEEERKQLIGRLEGEEAENALDYLFSVDVLNEGVDIPSVNQIIMLRPTQSAIIFVQQLGRGLRKSLSKRYLEVIDFIGNYENNYLLPVALYGGTKCGRSSTRRSITTNYLPGASTVYFTDVAKKRILESIENKDFLAMAKLKEVYTYVKAKLGYKPMMLDFLNHGDIDPYLFVLKEKSYYNFQSKLENNLHQLSAQQIKILNFISSEIASGKRLEEIVLLQYLLNYDKITEADFINLMRKKQVMTTADTLVSVKNVLQMDFFDNNSILIYGRSTPTAVTDYLKSFEDNKEILKLKKAEYISSCGKFSLIKEEGELMKLSDEFTSLLQDIEFTRYVKDALAYGKQAFLQNYNAKTYEYGLQLYSQYSRKDVCRILNWNKDESSTMFGYKNKAEYKTLPIFVTYRKEEGISKSINYNDHFYDRETFIWQTKNNVTLESKLIDMLAKNQKTVLLFIQQSKNDKTQFYFMGEVHYLRGTQEVIKNDKGQELPVVQVIYKMDIPVDDKMYNYFEG